MNNNPLEGTPIQYSEIKSVTDLKEFVNQTIALQVFEPASAGDSDGENTYMFQRSIIPLGKLRFRQ